MLVSTRFQVLFHSPPGVLFTFPSRYCFTIGHWVVFRLGGWSPHIPTGFHVPRGTLDTRCKQSVFAYGTLTLCGRPSQTFQLTYVYVMQVQTPENRSFLVWPLPISLATTLGISVDFFSSPYLDVSVRAVPPIQLWIHCIVHGLDPVWVSPFGNLWIDVYLPLPTAYRSLSRPSSAPSAKAFTLRSSSLNHIS